MEYEKLVQDIFRRFPSVQKEGFKPGAYKPGLEGVRDFDKVLGYPSRAIKTIHVAGTNGKGSVANMLAAALMAAGFKTGLYTSPHLVDFRERMRICGEMVPKDYVEEFLVKWKPYFEAENLSFFEITTGMAFRWFADQKVDIAVIEAGLGGRLDSTNLITPELSVITSIGLDHCALLGNTLQEIAREKAGIIKPGVTCVIGESNPDTTPAFEENASKRDPGVKLVFADQVEPRLWDRHEEILAAMDLQAPAQRKNLRTVLCALEQIQGRFTLSDYSILYGIEHAAALMHFHGRWERLREKPLVIADIGHNAHALRNNFAALEAMNRPLIIVYGIMADKDLGSIIPLMPKQARYIFVAPDTPRALPAEKIMEQVKAALQGAAPEMSVAPSVKAGMEIAMKEAAQDTVIYVGGSTFVVAEVL